MIATRWIGGISLVLGIVVIGSAADASVETGETPTSGFDVREVQIIDPESELERLGAQLQYDEGKIGRPVIEVDLSGCPISDETLKTLLPLRHLRVLNLRGTRVTVKGLKTLEAIQSLRRLDLCDTPHLSHASILRLREAIPFLSIHVGCWSGQSVYLPPPAVVP